VQGFPPRREIKRVSFSAGETRRGGLRLSVVQERSGYKGVRDPGIEIRGAQRKVWTTKSLRRKEFITSRLQFLGRGGKDGRRQPFGKKRGNRRHLLKGGRGRGSTESFSNERQCCNGGATVFQRWGARREISPMVWINRRDGGGSEDEKKLTKGP